MNQVKVRGGIRKENAVEDISRRTGTAISEMIVLGDSITDINMLERVRDEGGIAISFNGNKFSLKRANIAVTTLNSLGVLPIFEWKHKIYEFLSDWESEFESFKNYPMKITGGLVSKDTKELFIKHNFTPELANLTNKTEIQYSEIISKQEITRKRVRGWTGNLG